MIVTMLLSLLAVSPLSVEAKIIAPKVEVVRDYGVGELPEGIAFDKMGNMYVSIQSKGEIWTIRPNGEESLLFSVPTAAAFGLTVDDCGNVYATFALGTSGNGVYCITKDGEGTLLPGTENIHWANALVFDERGNLYITDTWDGAIWRVTPGGSAQIWLQHDLLEGLGPDDPGKVPGFPPVGANGIVYWHDNLYVANTEKGLLLRVPIMKKGTAGAPQVVAGEVDKIGGVDGNLYGLDGIALDMSGNVYGALVLQNKLVKVNPHNGKVEVLLTADDGLSNPASLAFGAGKHDHRTIFFTNFSLIDPTFGKGPAVLKFNVCVPGLPLP
jgi:sugar lactone lactonase YvrE